MTDQDIAILSAIASTEETSFNEFCSAYPDTPEPGNKAEWRALFDSLRDLERRCYIEVTRTNNKIDGMVLTEAGANLIRERLDAKRGLLSVLPAGDD